MMTDKIVAMMRQLVYRSLFGCESKLSDCIVDLDFFYRLACWSYFYVPSIFILLIGIS